MSIGDCFSWKQSNTFLAARLFSFKPGRETHKLDIYCVYDPIFTDDEAPLLSFKFN